MKKWPFTYTGLFRKRIWSLPWGRSFTTYHGQWSWTTDEILNLPIQTSLANEADMLNLYKNVLTVAHGFLKEASERNQMQPDVNTFNNPSHLLEPGTTTSSISVSSISLAVSMPDSLTYSSIGSYTCGVQVCQKKNIYSPQYEGDSPHLSVQ